MPRNESYRHQLLCILAVVFTIKALGGTFNALFYHLGAPLAHGPVMGVLIACFLFAGILTYGPYSEADARIPISRPALATFLTAALLLIAAGMYLRIQVIRATPLDPLRADMLPTVLTQIRDFLVGKTPFGPARLENGEHVVRCYWPVLWGSFIPLYLTGIDIRYLNVFGHLVFYLLLFDCFLHRRRFFAWGAVPSMLLFLTLLGLHVFSKQAIHEVYDVQTGPFWICYSLFVWSVLRQKERVTNLVIPFLLLCRQPAILLVIPYWLALAKQDVRRLLTSIGWTVATGLALTAPFLIRDPKGFFGGIFFYAGTVDYTPAKTMLGGYGLLGVLKMFGMARLGLLFQVLGVLTACALVWRRGKQDLVYSLGAGVIAYFTFMLFVSMTFKYLLVEPVLFLFFLTFAPCLHPMVRIEKAPTPETYHALATSS